MNQNILDAELAESWWSNSSAKGGVLEKYRNHLHDVILNAQVDFENFAGNFATHKKIVAESASNAESARPLIYIKMPNVHTFSSVNSSGNLLGSVSEYYEKIEGQLQKLNETDDEDEAVEKGAISSALALVDQLKQHNLAPPALSWHGGDAVVMLWALGDTTYAITVTEGEVGYVVRRNRKAIRMADSIKLGAFKLADLR
jgi:hypothetical protein